MTADSIKTIATWIIWGTAALLSAIPLVLWLIDGRRGAYLLCDDGGCLRLPRQGISLERDTVKAVQLLSYLKTGGECSNLDFELGLVCRDQNNQMGKILLIKPSRMYSGYSFEGELLKTTAQLARLLALPIQRVHDNQELFSAVADNFPQENRKFKKPVHQSPMWKNIFGERRSCGK